MSRLRNTWMDEEMDGWLTTAITEGERQQGLLKLSVFSMFTWIEPLLKCTVTTMTMYNLTRKCKMTGIILMSQ